MSDIEPAEAGLTIDAVRDFASLLMTRVHGREHSYETLWEVCDHPLCKEAQAVLGVLIDGCQEAPDA